LLENYMENYFIYLGSCIENVKDGESLD